MDVTESLLPDPLFHPLPPSIDSLITWFDELEYEGNQISFEWADNEIKNHLLGYVRVGLVAWRVKYYKLYRKGKKKFDSFRDYCTKGLGKSLWYINCLIKAGKAVLALVKAGFTFLPTCEAQARPLTKLKTGEEVVAKWQEVLDSAPAHRITSTLVTEVVEGESEPKNKRIDVDANTYTQLRSKALQSGLSVKELLSKLVEDYQPQDPELPVEEDSQPVEEAAPEPVQDRSPITRQQLQRWQDDLQQLLIQYYGLDSLSDSDASLSPVSSTSTFLPVQAQNPPELVKGRAISFGWTSKQLLAGLKTCTRRVWDDSYVKCFIKAFNEGRGIPAIDKDYRYGGKIIGHLRLTCCPYKEKLSDMPESDLEAEGGMCDSINQFIDKYFKGDRTLCVWVLRFEFQPLGKQPSSLPNDEQQWRFRTVSGSS